MMGQIKHLLKIELCNLYGFNVFRHTKDSKARKKNMAMAVIIGAVVVMLMCYVGGLCYSLIMLEAAAIIPAYLIAIASLVTIAFGVFKAGGVIFRNKGYDIISSLPLSNGAVVASRFLRLYVENLILTALVMLSGLAVYAVFIRPGVGFYLVGLLSVFITPLIPAAVAAGIGAVITGISSRMKHKSLVEAGLSVLIVVGVLVGSSALSGNAGELTQEMMKNLADMVTEVLGKIYPPAILLGNAIVQGSFLNFALVAVISILVFAFVVAVVAVKFHAICRRLYSTSAKHNYKMEHLQKNSVLKALVVREAKRYFSSGVYVTNTIMGPILGVALSIGLLFIDFTSVTATFPISLNINAAIPFAIAAVFSMMNLTSVSVSMEGREWWIVKSLPLAAKTILDSKVLFSLCLFAPFYIVSEIFTIIALRPDIMELIWLLLVPALIILFSSVFGITVNLLLPKLDWENEVTVVKQSASAVVGGMGGALVALLCVPVALLLPAGYLNIVCAVVCALLVAVTAVLYRRNSRVDLKTL